MKRTALPAVFSALPLLLAACIVLPPSPAVVAQGKALAETRCAACHAVAPGQLSRMPDAPSFEAIANREGLTRETLHAYLRDSHNFPSQMNFVLTPAQVEHLAAYVVTLQRADYHPPI